MKFRSCSRLLPLIFALFSSHSALALPEAEVKASLDTKIIPFLQSGEQFFFPSEDGLNLSAIHFENPAHLGTIVFVEGRSESWLKFGEVFFDLYQRGYSIYAYDHRGQGLSPHLSSVNPQIGHVKFFSDYAHDLHAFVETVVLPHSVGQKLYLLSHSMGGAVAMDYLENYDHPFSKAIFAAPMLEINTKPYPEAVGLSIVKLQILLGKGQNYAITQRDYQTDLPFESNTLTRSEPRFWMTNEILRRNPKSIIGGTSNNWIAQSIQATHRIRKAAERVEIPFLLFQSEKDQIVKPRGQATACANAGTLCTLEVMPDSQHEILMERDSIRVRALERISQFFN